MTVEQPTDTNKKNEVYNIETLSAQTKMRMLLEIFDLAKDKDKDKIDERKNKFLDLVRQYHESSIVRKIEMQAEVDTNFLKRKKQKADTSNRRKAEIHNQIMDIITKMSLSQGLTKSQRELVSYLADDRSRIEIMIHNYYLNHDSTNPRQHDELHQALRGEGFFSSPPNKDE